MKICSKNKKLTEIGHLAKLLELKVANKVMRPVNTDIQNRLTNGQVGEVSHFGSMNNIIKVLYVKFNRHKLGVKAMLHNQYTKQKSVVLIAKNKHICKSVKKSFVQILKKKKEKKKEKENQFTLDLP